MKIDGHNIIKSLEGHLSGITEPRNCSIENRNDINGQCWGDNVDLSHKGIEFIRMKKAISGIPEIREEKVNGLSDEIRGGVYGVSAELIGARLLREHITDELLRLKE